MDGRAPGLPLSPEAWSSPDRDQAAWKSFFEDLELQMVKKIDRIMFKYLDRHLA